MVGQRVELFPCHQPPDEIGLMSGSDSSPG